MEVNDHSLDGTGCLELRGASEGPNVDQGTNPALCPEAAWIPSICAADPQIRWQSSGEDMAELVVDSGEAKKHLVHNDPETGLTRSMESIRYKKADS